MIKVGPRVVNITGCLAFRVPLKVPLNEVSSRVSGLRSMESEVGARVSIRGS